MKHELKQLQIEKASIADDEHSEIIKMMTPQEKAKDLVEKFENGLTLKDCALITVDEILESIKYLPYGIQYLSTRDYWMDVRQEIEKL